MSEKQRQIKQLWQDALTGKASRREVLVRGSALGLSAAVLASLSKETMRGVMAAEEGDPSVTIYQWQADLHPGLFTVGDELGVRVEVAPTEGFGFERFVAEAQSENSTWDFYTGVTPFLEMTSLAGSGTIEPWDPYLPEGVLDDLIPATREEGTHEGSLYVWPFLLDVIVQGWNAKIVAEAGLDPEVAPANWDEFIEAGRVVQESGAAPYGLTFDFHDWRSLLPITHSIDTDVYTPDGLFMYTSDAAVEALEIMKRIYEYSNPDTLNEGTTDGGVNNTPDEQVFAAEQAGYYIKYENAHLRFSAAWPDPSQLRLAALPVQEGGVGGTVFWTTGAVLFTYGANKEKAAEYMLAACNDDRIWENSIVGNPDEGTIPVGQMPTLQSVWARWETEQPEFYAANQWTRSIYDGLGTARAIAPSVLSASQFTVARPEWVKYLNGEVDDARTALTAAWDAVAAEFERQTGNAPQ